MITDERNEVDFVELRRRATLAEYDFLRGATGAAAVAARLRAAWNSMATKWQVRPLAERQTIFNHALADWLEQHRGTGSSRTADVIELDRAAARLNRDTGEVAVHVVRTKGDLDGLGRDVERGTRQLRLAHFSPLPPTRSGIADYSAELLPHLAARAEVTLFSDGPDRPTGNLPRRPLAAYPAERWAYDLPLYHMGNSAYHRDIYRMLLRYPGVVVLHDAILHQFVAHETLGRGNFPAYAREMRYALGAAGVNQLRAIQSGREPLPVAELPLNERLLDTSLGIIVHSRHVAEQIRAARSGVQVRVIPHMVAPRAARSRRAELGLAESTLLIAAVGQVTTAKQLPLALRAFRRLMGFVPDARFLIVGEILPEVDLDGVVGELELGERVIFVDYVESLDAFHDWAATADVVLNLRYPTLGETSGAALHVMSAGRTLVVFNHGWYAEIPDEAVVKVPPMDEAALLAGLLELARSTERRAALGAAAARYVRAECAPGVVADAYVDFLIDVLEPGW